MGYAVESLSVELSGAKSYSQVLLLLLSLLLWSLLYSSSSSYPVFFPPQSLDRRCARAGTSRHTHRYAHFSFFFSTSSGPCFLFSSFPLLLPWGFQQNTAYHIRISAPRSSSSLLTSLYTQSENISFLFCYTPIESTTLINIGASKHEHARSLLLSPILMLYSLFAFQCSLSAYFFVLLHCLNFVL